MAKCVPDGYHTATPYLCIGGATEALAFYAKAFGARALEAGAIQKESLQDKFYGDRSGTVVDPFGHLWHIATHKEDVPPDELSRRLEAMGMKG